VAYSFYENKDNGEIFSKEDQQKWNEEKKAEKSAPGSKVE
jgi:hypothetical protein